MEYQPFDQKCLTLLSEYPHWHSRHCFRGAVNHLELGEKLLPVDINMAVFRLITAEEEAASGLMRCLQEVGYKNAKLLKPKDHFQKHAIIPFFTVLRSFIDDSFAQYGIKIQIVFDDSERPYRVRLQVEMQGEDGPVTFIPEPPLNFSFVCEAKRFSFQPQITAYLESKGLAIMKDHLEKVANLRNTVLYASHQGFPKSVQIEDRFITAYTNRVLAMLRTYLMIAPYRQPLPFVQDSLDSFLCMLGRLQLEDIHERL